MNPSPPPTTKPEPRAKAFARNFDWIATVAILGGACLYGYLANIYWLWRMDWTLKISLWMTLRIAGIMFPPLGIVLGFFHHS